MYAVRLEKQDAGFIFTGSPTETVLMLSKLPCQKDMLLKLCTKSTVVFIMYKVQMQAHVQAIPY